MCGTARTVTAAVARDPQVGRLVGVDLDPRYPGVAQRRLAGHDRRKVAADHLGQADLVEHVPDV